MAPGAKIQGSKVEMEGEKCGLDMSSFEDLPPPTVGADCNGDARDDYVIVNGSDAGSDDHTEADGNGGPDVAELDVKHSNENVGGVDGTVNGDGQFEVHIGVVALDDPGEQGENGELNSSGSSVDPSEKVGGSAAEIDASDGSEVDNGHGDKLDNEIKEGEASEVPDRVIVEAENEGKVEGEELAKENGEFKPKNEVVDDDGQLVVENGDTNNMGSDVDGKVEDLDVVEGNHTELVPCEAEDCESCIRKEDVCNSAVDGAGSPVNDEVQHGTSVVEATTVVSEGCFEQQHLMEPQHDEDQGNNLETEIVTGVPLVVGDDVQAHADQVVDVEMEPSDSNAKYLKPSDESDVECQSLEDGVSNMQPLDAEVKAAYLSASSEPHPLHPESKEPSMDDAVPENQSLDCQQPELQPADDGNEQAPNDAEAGVKKQGDLDASNVAVDQEFNSVDSEAVMCDVKQSEECVIKVQRTTDLTAESHEIQDLQTENVQSEGAENWSSDLGSGEAENEVTREGVLEPPNTAVDHEFISSDPEAVKRKLNQSEGQETKIENATELTVEAEEVSESQSAIVQSEEALNHSGIESTAVSVEGLVSDSTTHVDSSKPELTAEVDCETEQVEGKSDLITEEVGDQESPNGDRVLLDRVSEEIGSVSVTNKDVDVEKTVQVEEATNPSEIKALNDALVDQDKSDLGRVCDSEVKVSDSLVNDSETPPMSGKTSSDADGSLKSEESNLSIAVHTAAESSVFSDVDTIKEQVVENAASASDTNSSADDLCPQLKAESGSGSLPNHVHDTGREVTAANGSIDVASKSNDISSETLKPKISFGSFVCEAPFSDNDVSIRPDLQNRSIELTSGQSNVTAVNSKSKTKPSNGIALLNAEVNGVHFTGLKHDKTCPEVSSLEHVNADEVSSLPIEGSEAAASKGHTTESQRIPFYYLIRVPRYDDEKLREQIRLSELQVEEKTQTRDAVRVEYLKMKGAIIQLKSVLEAAKSEERAARELVKAKRREIDSSQSLVNLAKNALTVEDVHAQILNMEHKIQHETLHLNEEKQLVREIKQMKNLKDQLYGNAQKQEELKQALDQKDQVEEQLKILRKELGSLRDNLSKAQESVKAAKKKYDKESALVNEFYAKFKSADNVRQDAYVHLQDLRKQWSEKNKHFRSYKDDARAANDFAAAGNKDSLECHCVNQVEKFMELWNKNDEFRKEYIKYNTRSTLRRLKTLDGRSLGPDEEPRSSENISDDRVPVLAKVNSVAVSTTEREIPTGTKNVEQNSLKEVIEQKNKAVPAKKKAEATSKNSLAEASGRFEIEEDKEEHKPRKEEEELARKTEQLRREEEAARLREQRRQEEKAKAQEALERKKRMAEKAQARAEFRAQKEAEEKEKEREKRAKKKDKKKGLISETTESEPTVPLGSPSETTREPEVTEKPVTVAKKPQKPSPYAKQIKTTKSIPPPPLRNRAKRRMQQWMWAVATVVAILALFFLGNSNFFRNNSLLDFGPSY